MHRQRTVLAQNCGEGFPLDMLKYKIRLTILNVGFKQGHYIGVGQATHAAGLLHPLGNLQCVCTGPHFHQFDGNFSFEMGVKCQPDDRLGAFAQNPFQLKSSQTRRLTWGNFAANELADHGQRGRSAHESFT